MTTWYVVQEVRRISPYGEHRYWWVDSGCYGNEASARLILDQIRDRGNVARLLRQTNEVIDDHPGDAVLIQSGAAQSA